MWIRSEARRPSRREFITLGVGAFAVVSTPLVRWWWEKRELVRRAIPIMGTLGDIVVVHRDRQYAHGAISAAFERLRLVERTLSRYRDDSDVGRANRRAAMNGVPVSLMTQRVLEEGLRWAGATDGRFDPCLGRAVTLWGVTDRTAPPDGETVRLFAGRRLFEALEVSTWRGRPAVRFGSRDVAIDLGGIGKGYGVDQAVQVLRDWGIADALVNLGGDLHAMGRSQDGDPWRVGVRSPDRAERTIATVSVQDAAIATSGDYLQYFEHRGRRYHHLLDPETGEPRTSPMRSLTVRADDCMTADAAATAAFGLPVADGRDQIRRIAPRAVVAHTA